ncbi:tetratricopeptide repeat protein [Chloroflexus sp.]|uniref:tetratricopeptide repeat protein n=1 Tax=Chloroflexus sp. TaxID=1904827 RepID=UPI002ACD6E70|nr:tetratricopeptide repeat protein [Chloroflexus sp.]
MHLTHLGMAAIRVGAYQHAIACLERAIQINRELGIETDDPTNQGNRGIAYANLGDYPNAIGHYEAANELCRQQQDVRGEAIWVGNLAK